MSDITIISEKALSMTDVKDILEGKGKKNIGVRGAKTLSYIDDVLQGRKKKDIMEKLIKLEIGRIKEKHLKKIADIMPEDLDSLRMLFTAENITLKQDDLEKILDVIKNA